MPVEKGRATLLSYGCSEWEKAKSHGPAAERVNLRPEMDGIEKRYIPTLPYRVVRTIWCVGAGDPSSRSARNATRGNP